MYFDSISAMLEMDGHGVYVWTAYAITLVVVFLLLWVPQRRQRLFLLQLTAEERRRQGAPQPGTPQPGTPQPGTPDHPAPPEQALQPEVRDN